VTGQHREPAPEHRPGPGCWAAAIVGAVIVLACMGLWRLWVGP
jgi:hypothetical protein